MSLIVSEIISSDLDESQGYMDYMDYMDDMRKDYTERGRVGRHAKWNTCLLSVDLP